MASIKELNKLWRKSEDYINSKTDALSKNVRRAAKDMVSVLYEKYTSQLDIDANGIIKPTSRNYRIVNQLDRSLKNYLDTVIKTINTQLGKDLLNLTNFSYKYFLAYPDLAEQAVNSARESLTFINQAIGIDQNGEIIKNSYLDKLGNIEEVKIKIKKYTQSSIAGRKSYNGFLSGIRQIVEGTKEREGILNKYYRQYAFDSFNQTDASVNLHYANSLGMKSFIYAGYLIDTSREFCRKRAGKTFTIEETKKWKNDPTLVYTNKASYNPLIDRGGYNCRHRIRYITETLAEEKKEKEDKK